MPYLLPEDRTRIVNSSKELITINAINSAGDLQYAIAEMIHSYLFRTGLSYQNCNNIMGALAGAQMEFYRKVVAPYEDEKIELNGKVYSHNYHNYPLARKY